MNLPNKLTVFRLLTVPIIIIALYIQTAWSFIAAVVLLILAWLSDFFDGFIARKKNLKTKFGAFFDPFVDKTLVIFTFIALGGLGIIPMWMVILMVFRDFITQGIRSMVKAEGVILKSEWSGKIKFVLQISTLLFATILISLSFYFPSIKSWMLRAIFWVMAVALIESYYALFEFLYKNRKIIKSWF